MAVIFLAFPVIYIVVAATLFDIPLNTCIGILLSPFYYIVSLCAMITGYGLWEMRRWSWYLFILFQILLTYENALFVHGYAESHHKMLAFLFSILIQVILIYRVAGEIRVPYFFPRIRWWESNPRYRLTVPVTFTTKSGQQWEGEILDLSIVGCFVKLRQDFIQHEKVNLSFKIYGHEFQCDGTAVWLAVSTVTHPKGIGIKFTHLSKNQRRSLRLITRKLKKISDFYRRSRYLMSQEEFLKKLEELESDGIPS